MSSQNKKLDYLYNKNIDNTVNKFNHCAGIYINGKKICIGYNDNLRTYYKNNISCSMHAEINVLYKYINVYSAMYSIQNPYKIRRKMRKIHLIIIRENNGISIPCLDCYTQLNKLFVKQITFVDDRGQIINEKTSNIQYLYDIRQSGCSKLNNKNMKTISLCRTR